MSAKEIEQNMYECYEFITLEMPGKSLKSKRKNTVFVFFNLKQVSFLASLSLFIHTFDFSLMHKLIYWILDN